MELDFGIWLFVLLSIVEIVDPLVGWENEGALVALIVITSAMTPAEVEIPHLRNVESRNCNLISY